MCQQERSHFFLLNPWLPYLHSTCDWIWKLWSGHDLPEDSKSTFTIFKLSASSSWLYWGKKLGLVPPLSLVHNPLRQEEPTACSSQWQSPKWNLWVGLLVKSPERQTDPLTTAVTRLLLALCCPHIPQQRIFVVAVSLPWLLSYHDPEDPRPAPEASTAFPSPNLNASHPLPCLAPSACLFSMLYLWVAKA